MLDWLSYSDLGMLHSFIDVIVSLESSKGGLIIGLIFVNPIIQIDILVMQIMY